MSPEELSALHPRLFHVTLPAMSGSIRRHGLLSTSRLLDLFDIRGAARERLERCRRPGPVHLHHPGHGSVTLNDQTPMSEAALAGCLDDGLSPADWIEILNRRVFFWADGNRLARLVGARANRVRAIDVMVVDTQRLAQRHADRIELCPINSGATIRKAARRGLQTFTPLLALPYKTWTQQRGARDKIVEVTVLDGVPDIASYVIDIRRIEPAPSTAAGGRVL
jgi:hypothetical protein